MRKTTIVLILLAIPLLLLGADPVKRPDPPSGVFSVQHYGAKGDGQTDDTAAIQAAIDAACVGGEPAKNSRAAKGVVELPAGDFRITKPLKIRSVAYLTFKGAGKSTRLHPVGKMDAVLDINGAAYSTFSDFLIQGDSIHEEVENAIYFYHDRAEAGRTSGGCVFRNIQVHDTKFVTGFRIGKWKSTSQVDTSAYENIIIAGKEKKPGDPWWQSAFVVGSGIHGNNLIHSFWNCDAVGCDNGFWVAATNFMLCGGSVGNNKVDFKADVLSYFLVQGIRSENSERLLTSGAGATSAVANLSLTDILWTANKLAKDNVIIQSHANGALAIRNLSIASSGAQAKMVLTPYRSCTLILDGVTCYSPIEEFLSGINKNVDVSVRGFVTCSLKGGFSETTRGIVTNSPIRWQGSGNLWSTDGGLFFQADGGRPITIVKPRAGKR